MKNFFLGFQYIIYSHLHSVIIGEWSFYVSASRLITKELLFCWLFLLFVKIDAATFEVNMTKSSKPSILINFTWRQKDHWELKYCIELQYEEILRHTNFQHLEIASLTRNLEKKSDFSPDFYGNNILLSHFQESPSVLIISFCRIITVESSICITAFHKFQIFLNF